MSHSICIPLRLSILLHLRRVGRVVWKACDEWLWLKRLQLLKTYTRNLVCQSPNKHMMLWLRGGITPEITRLQWIAMQSINCKKYLYMVVDFFQSLYIVYISVLFHRVLEIQSVWRLTYRATNLLCLDSDTSSDPDRAQVVPSALDTPSNGLRSNPGMAQGTALSTCSAVIFPETCMNINANLKASDLSASGGLVRNAGV